ncbi:Importin-beta protein [Dictyocaulus viviparus]|uniref:Importin-beta protein n=1 Tax=Dictyocaulus viviparus TaxID=29172 RepID=A0A0D8XG55_DICVI|nr:Importin-beta protein [Dictyocaulus viviparus]
MSSYIFALGHFVIEMPDFYILGELIKRYGYNVSLYADNSKCSKQQGFTSELLNIICDNSVSVPVRQCAAIYFKNNVVRLWEASESLLDSQGNKDCENLAEEDKAFVREHVIDAVCAAPESSRIQLCIAIQEILRADFPKRWPDFGDKILAKIHQPLDASILFKSSKDKDVVVGPILKIEPIIYQHCVHLLDVQSVEAISIQIQGLKMIYVLTQFSINFQMLPSCRLDDWIKFSIDILNRNCPEEASTYILYTLDEIEEKEERAHTVWWKCKKWAAKFLDRLFQRYGSPNCVEDQYVNFARHFMANWASSALQSSLAILNARRNNVYVSDRVLHHMLSFTNTAIAHSMCWRFIKPHALDLVKHVLFKLMCYDDDDEEMWEENVEEYIRFKFDIFEDLHNPVYGASALLLGLAKRKGVVQSVIVFIVQVLSNSDNSHEIEGALRMIGELYVHLSRNKIVESLILCLCDPNEELPVQVESALAIQCLLKKQERVHAIVQPSVGKIILKVLELVAKTQIEDVIYVVDEFLDQYNNEIVPVVADIAEHLVVEDHMEIMVKVETSVLKIIRSIFQTENFEFYCNVMLLLQSLLQSYVSEPMWDVFDELYRLFKTTDRVSILPFSDIAQVLHLYIVTDTESFLAFPHRLNAILDMCHITLKDDTCGDENHLYSAKIMECILLECPSHSVEAIPIIIMAAFERLSRPFQDGLNELKPLLLLVVVAALYVNLDVTLQAFRYIAPNYSNLLEYICDEFLTCYEKIEGIHNRRMALIGICLYFRLPSHLRPSLISTNPKKVLEVSLSLFENLIRAQKVQAHNKADESETDDSDEESNDEADRKVLKKSQFHRKVREPEHLSDDEDEIDEMTLDYMDAMAKEGRQAGEDDEDVDSDSAIESSIREETDSEAFTTTFDGEEGLDVFVFFKQTMEEFERNEPALFLKMVGNLSPQVAESLRNLIKECEQHVKSEESKQVEQAGGYNFDAAAGVPENFNFTS